MRAVFSGRLRLIVIASVVAALAAVATAGVAIGHGSSGNHKGHSKTVELRLLATNDLHGGVLPIDTARGVVVPDVGAAPVTVGGMEYLATHIRRLRAQADNSFLLSGGDNWDNSPLLSTLFHHEPTAEAMNAVGYQLSVVGNHELDEGGAAEFFRMADGGCHPVDGCQDGTPYRGVDFPYIAANVRWKDTGELLTRPFVVRRFEGVKVGFIGAVLKETPGALTDPALVNELEFGSESEAINRYARKLRRRGVEALVAVLHQGGSQAAAGGINTCNGGLTGDIVPILGAITPAVDAVFNGHSHLAYNCVIDGRPVIQGSAHGRLISRIDLEISRKTGDVVSFEAFNHMNTRDVPKDPKVTKVIDHWNPFYLPIATKVIGRLAGPANRVQDASGETQAGNLIADSYQAFLEPAGRGGAVASFMNDGGVQADYAAGDLTYAKAFDVQPFGNRLGTTTLSGAQLYELLKQQWCGRSFQRILPPSAELTYTFDRSVADAVLNTPCAGATNPVSDLAIGGTAVDPAQNYRIGLNTFLIPGGDGFSVAATGTNVQILSDTDLDAMEEYLAPTLSGSPLTIPAQDRITVVP